MEPLVIILVPGVLGGLAMAAVFLLFRGRSTRPSASAQRLDPISTDIINMASIKVAGVGGLGLVAMSVAVALGIPRIAQAEAIGIGLGAVGALVVILYRRRTGVMPSSGQGLGANTMLRIEGASPDSRSDERGPTRIDRTLALIPR